MNIQQHKEAEDMAQLLKQKFIPYTPYPCESGIAACEVYISLEIENKQAVEFWELVITKLKKIAV